MPEPTLTPRSGIGAVLNKWDSVAGAWVEITYITGMSWDGPSRETIEYFALNQTDSYVSKLRGVINAGSMTVTLLYTSQEFNRMKTDLETDQDQSYQIVLPNGEGIEFDGFISELPLDIGSDDVMQGEMVIEINGKADFVSSASTSP